MVGPGHGSPVPRLEVDASRDEGAAAQVAAAGVAGPGQALPHAEAIQLSFGTHDVSAVRAHVGGHAGQAADVLGADAFATGDDIAFRRSPDLHTAAHEAAHVVQQRGGVQLKDGLGRAGDQHERHADAVADRVVRGESAQTLLDECATGTSQKAVQMRPRGGDQAKPEAETEAQAAHPAPGSTAQNGVNAAPKMGPPRVGAERVPAHGDVDTQSVGVAFAASLSDEELEQTIDHLITRRDSPDIQPADREVASGNLAVLAAESRRRGRPSGALDRDAVQTLIQDAHAGVSELAAMLRSIAANPDAYSLRAQMGRFLEYAVDRLAWVTDAIGASVRYLNLAGASGQQGVALLTMAATRAQAAHVGLAILRPWSALLQLHDQVAMLRILNIEYRHRVLAGAQGRVGGLFAQIASFDPDAVTTASANAPGRVTGLAAAFEETAAQAETAQKRQIQAMQLQAAMELATFVVSLRGMFAMRGPPSTMSVPMPVVAGAGGGAATMGRIVVSAEWIAAIKHLIEIGAITAAAAAEMLRVRGFTHAMAQASDLPPSVKDLLGEGPTTDAMHVTGANRAGADRPPRHHVMPQKERKFFEERGFTGDLDIDNFCVELSRPEHEALHGGGNWKLGQTWVEEWNRLVMARLREREQLLGRHLTVADIMAVVERVMRDRRVPVSFVPYRGGD
jgi:hypothetical protein